MNKKQEKSLYRGMILSALHKTSKDIMKGKLLSYYDFMYYCYENNKTEEEIFFRVDYFRIESGEDVFGNPKVYIRVLVNGAFDFECGFKIDRAANSDEQIPQGFYVNEYFEDPRY